MKEKMIYLCKIREEKLNEEERKYKKISYRTLLDYYDINCILCNNIVDIDECLYDNVEVGTLYDEETDEYKDIYQYYIIDLSQWELEDIKEKYNDELIICYSEKLDNYVLCVDHLGTSWNYVLTDIEFTTDYEEYKNWEKEKNNND